MKTKDAAKIIKELAVKNCTSESEIRREMKLAILEWYKNSYTRENWNRILGEGNLPTPEEFIIIMAQQVKCVVQNWIRNI